MTRHLVRWLNNKYFDEFGDYTGRIDDVIEETIRNSYTGEKKLEPVILFEDGLRLLPNIGQRRALIDLFGPETDDWIGREIQVYRTRTVRIDKATGAERIKFEKGVCLPLRAVQAQAR